MRFIGITGNYWVVVAKSLHPLIRRSMNVGRPMQRECGLGGTGSGDRQAWGESRKSSREPELSACDSFPRPRESRGRFLPRRGPSTDCAAGCRTSHGPGPAGVDCDRQDEEKVCAWILGRHVQGFEYRNSCHQDRRVTISLSRFLLVWATTVISAKSIASENSAMPTNQQSCLKRSLLRPFRLRMTRIMSGNRPEENRT